MILSLLLSLLLAAPPQNSPLASQPAADWKMIWAEARTAADSLARFCRGYFQSVPQPAVSTEVVQAVLPSPGPADQVAVSQPRPAIGGIALNNLGVGLIAALAVGLVPLSLAMLTSYIRISVVLALLRTGLAAPGVPPVSVQTGLAILLTAVVMAPTLGRVWTESVQPVLAGQLDPHVGAAGAMAPVREFMVRQVDATHQHDKVRLFTDRAHLPAPKSWDDVPTSALVPGYCLAELHTAFAIGVRLLVPFLVLDLMVAAVLVSLGLFLVPPTLVSLPLKLLLFVAADGWGLVVGNLLKGFAG